MTFREKIQKEHPECVKAETYGGVLGCPSVYGYESGEKGLCYVGYRHRAKTCTKCWDREMPTEDNTTKNISEEFNTFVCDKCLIKIEDFVKVEILLGLYGVEYEDTKDYKFKFCPECGRKVVE